MIKIEGLTKLTQTLEDAQKAISQLDGEIGHVKFDPEDPGSIEAAIQSMEQAIDERVGQYANNEIVAPMIEELKERYREAILEKAAAARLGAADE